MRQPVRADLLLLLAAAIWGFAFVAQRLGMHDVGPLTFNAARFALGALVLVPLARAGAAAAAPWRDDLPRGLTLGVDPLRRCRPPAVGHDHHRRRARPASSPVST